MIPSIGSDIHICLQIYMYIYILYIFICMYVCTARIRRRWRNAVNERARTTYPRYFPTMITTWVVHARRLRFRWVANFNDLPVIHTSCKRVENKNPSLVCFDDALFGGRKDPERVALILCGEAAEKILRLVFVSHTSGWNKKRRRDISLLESR